MVYLYYTCGNSQNALIPFYPHLCVMRVHVYIMFNFGCTHWTGRGGGSHYTRPERGRRAEHHQLCSIKPVAVALHLHGIKSFSSFFFRTSEHNVYS